MLRISQSRGIGALFNELPERSDEGATFLHLMLFTIGEEVRRWGVVLRDALCGSIIKPNRFTVSAYLGLKGN
jgi:hypothetical protein